MNIHLVYRKNWNKEIFLKHCEFFIIMGYILYIVWKYTVNLEAHISSSLKKCQIPYCLMKIRTLSHISAMDIRD